jgi:hypothetical protein
MCIIIGKYFSGQGWVGLKNRDRNYVPDISFQKTHHKGLEIMGFHDDVTGYSEGFNSAGVSILSASLMVQDDEKEIEKDSDGHSPDGVKIRRALKNHSTVDACQSLIQQKLPGNTLIFDQRRMYLLEGCWSPGGYQRRDYVYKIRQIPRDQEVVRTNHGQWLSWAGYQRGGSESETLSRISSESRLLIARSVAHQGRDPEDILDGLTRDYTGDGQLNALRTTTRRKKMRTTSQIMIVPRERTMYVRPVQSHLHFDFWHLNRPQQLTWIEILSNRVLYSNLRDLDPGNDPPFANSLNHDTGQNG